MKTGRIRDFFEGKEIRQRFFSTFTARSGRPPLPFEISFAEKSLTCLENSRTRYEPGVQTGRTRSRVFAPVRRPVPGSISIVIS